MFLYFLELDNTVKSGQRVFDIYLNGDLKEKVYVEQPMSFVLHGNGKNVCKLIKSLYDLKQAPK